MGIDAVTGHWSVPVFAAGAALAWSNIALPVLTHRFGWSRDARTAATVVFCTADAAVARCERLPAAAGVLGAGLALAGTLSTASVTRDQPSNLRKWVLWDIPVGTAGPEEILFRGGVTPAFERSFGRARGSVLGAATFGLWHIGAARSARDSIMRTIAVTFVAGYGFDELRRRSRRLWPPFLAHWAINSAGAMLSRSSAFSSPGTDAT